MKQVLLFLWNSRTTAFGYIVIIVGVLAASDGLFSPGALKWIIVLNGICTACIGHYNNLQIRRAANAGDNPPARQP